MRILTVAPGPTFSTYDTWYYYTRAFRQAGHTVSSFKYHDHYQYHLSAMGNIYDGDSYEDLSSRAITMASEYLIARIARFVPDVVFIVSGIAFPLAVWDWLDSFRDSLKDPYVTALFLTESPYLDDTQSIIARRADISFTTEKNSVDDLGRSGASVKYIRHAFDPAVHYTRATDSSYRADVFMVGTGFPERVHLLSSVDWSGVDLRIFGDHWDRFAGYDKIKDMYEPVYLDNSTDVPRWYTNSVVSLNIFRRSAGMSPDDASPIDPGSAYSISPRCYEIMGCGGLLVTDWRDEIGDLFTPGEDLVVYDGPEDLGDKVRFYIDHPAERDRVAANGWLSARSHTYLSRARDIVGHIDEYAKRR